MRLNHDVKVALLLLALGTTIGAGGRVMFERLNAAPPAPQVHMQCRQAPSTGLQSNTPGVIVEPVLLCWRTP